MWSQITMLCDCFRKCLCISACFYILMAKFDIFNVDCYAVCEFWMNSKHNGQCWLPMRDDCLWDWLFLYACFPFLSSMIVVILHGCAHWTSVLVSKSFAGYAFLVLVSIEHLCQCCMAVWHCHVTRSASRSILTCVHVITDQRVSKDVPTESFAWSELARSA